MSSLYLKERHSLKIKGLREEPNKQALLSFPSLPHLPHTLWLIILLHDCVQVCVQSRSHVQLFVPPQTVACQAPLPMEFSRQEYWSGLPFLTAGDLPNPGIKPMPLASPALAGGFFTISTTWEAHMTVDSSSVQAHISQVCFFHFLVRILCQVELILNYYINFILNYYIKCDLFLLLIWIWKFKAGKDSSCLCLAGSYRRKERSPIWFWTGMHGV